MPCDNCGRAMITDIKKQKSMTDYDDKLKLCPTCRKAFENVKDKQKKNPEYYFDVEWKQ